MKQTYLILKFRQNPIDASIWCVVGFVKIDLRASDLRCINQTTNQVSKWIYIYIFSRSEMGIQKAQEIHGKGISFKRKKIYTIKRWIWRGKKKKNQWQMEKLRMKTEDELIILSPMASPSLFIFVLVILLPLIKSEKEKEFVSNMGETIYI